jgi:hypothetical protein
MPLIPAADLASAGEPSQYLPNYTTRGDFQSGYSGAD